MPEGLDCIFVQSFLPLPVPSRSRSSTAMDLSAKLAILADAAKYDASCASSGSAKRDSRDGQGLGSTEGMGICHSYAPDGRCISLLKVLLTNHCVYDCLYCVNRSSSNVPRARFRVEELVQLTLDFYRRNLIEGLFLSSGIIRSPDYTMEQVVEVARQLREDHHFRGYIHLKTIPDADPELIRQAGLFADRIVLVCRPDHPLAGRSAVTWAEMAVHPVVAMSRTTSVRQLMDVACAQAGVTIHPLYEASHLATIGGLVGAGSGVAALPSLSLPLLRFAGLSSVPLESPVMERGIGIVLRAGRTASVAARGLLAMLAQHREPPVAEDRSGDGVKVD